MSNELPGYDNWKLASPDDEEDFERPRPAPRRMADRGWGRRVENGRTIYEEDFIYDPLGD